ncbi:MAG TPA: hypothetical protein PK324_22450, partial [Nocardioides sp.]|nr:hypothetical protein [Nocardioides sp.]
DRPPFGAPASEADMAAAIVHVLGEQPDAVDGGLVTRPDPRLGPLAFAHGWRVEEGAEKAVIRPTTP